MPEPGTGLPWLIATVSDLRSETATAKTILFNVPDWPGHLAGQHLDIRLTAEDGYVAQRSFSLASPAGNSPTVEITVQYVRDGEVSPFLLEELRVGDQIELRGPIGGYFVWSPASRRPLMLIAGGSGVVPLMSILRTRRIAGNDAEARLLYSSRSVDQILYARELDQMSAAPGGPAIVHTLTRTTPPGWTGEHGRVERDMLARHAIDAREEPDIFVCGPTPFVESVADHLLSLGHAEPRIRTERFGPTGDAA
ncbi:ferredoxin reductase [Sphingomonas sp. PR090111-T3T-6A]|uniref:ferredoxin reductase n=1 Tax=Sphingomonas sp. PR090111-T3T-6A TaxID=685778 RepID=UPI0003781158|nr:ferredoxin reductase [Sphingomonas sp. PR090111-T3T-6A]